MVEDNAPAPIRHALVAIKDSRAALHVFIEALALSRLIGCRLAAVTVAPLYEGDLALTSVAAPRGGTNEPARIVLDEALEIAVEEGAGLQTFLARSVVHEALLKLLREGPFDLLILGRGSGWLAPWNVAARLARSSPVDVLVIPQKQPLRWRRLLCGAEPRLAAATRRRLAFLRERVSAPPIIDMLDATPALHRRLTQHAPHDSRDLIVCGAGPRLAGRLVRRTRLPLWIVKPPRAAAADDD